MSFRDFLNENAEEHEGFKIDTKDKKLTDAELVAVKSMIDLCMGYLKLKPCQIQIIRGGRSEQLWNSCRVKYYKKTELFVEDLAHELTHISQYQTGTVKDTGEVYDYDFLLWKGKRKKVYTNGQKYMDSPWEVEARDTAQKLLKMWKQFNR